MSKGYVTDIGAFGSCDTNFNPASVAAAGTATGSAIDLQSDTYRFGGTLAAALQLGAIGGGTIASGVTLIVQTSDASDFGSGVTTLADNSGSTAGVTATAENSSSATGSWNLAAADRYIRFSVTSNVTGGSGSICGVSAFLFRGEL